MMFPLSSIRHDGTQVNPHPIKLTQSVQLTVQSQPVTIHHDIGSSSIVTDSHSIPRTSSVSFSVPQLPLPFFIPGLPPLPRPQVFSIDPISGLPQPLPLSQPPPLLPDPLQTLSLRPAEILALAQSHNLGSASSQPPPLTLGQSPPLTLGQTPPLTLGQTPPLTLGQSPPLTVCQSPPLTVNQSPPSQRALSLPFPLGSQEQAVTISSPVVCRSTETITVIRETTCDINMNRGFPLPVTPYGYVNRDAPKATEIDTLLDGSKKEFMVTRAEKVALWRTFATVFHEKDKKLEVTDNTLLAIFLGLPSHIRRAVRHKGGIGAFLRECPWFHVVGDQIELIPGMEKLYHSQEDDIKETSCSTEEDADDSVPDSWEDLSLSDIDEGGYSYAETDSDYNQSLTESPGSQSRGSGQKETARTSKTAKKNRKERKPLNKDSVSNLKWGSESKEFVPSSACRPKETTVQTHVAEVWDECDDDDDVSVSQLVDKMEKLSAKGQGQQVDQINHFGSSRDAGQQNLDCVTDEWDREVQSYAAVVSSTTNSNGRDSKPQRERDAGGSPFPPAEPCFGSSSKKREEEKKTVGDQKDSPEKISPCKTEISKNRASESDTKAMATKGNLKPGIIREKGTGEDACLLVDSCNNIIKPSQCTTVTHNILGSLPLTETEKLRVERAVLEDLKLQAEKDLKGLYTYEDSPNYAVKMPVVAISEISTQTPVPSRMVDACLDCEDLGPKVVTTGMNTDPAPERMECFDHCKRALACCKSELQKAISEQSETEGRLSLVSTKLKVFELENKRLKDTIASLDDRLEKTQRRVSTDHKATVTDPDLFADPVKMLQRSLSETKQKLLHWNMKNIDLQAKLAFQLISQAYEESEIIYSMTKISLTKKASLTTQMVNYQAGLLRSKQAVDEWKLKSERILASGGSADTLPPVPDIDIQKFTPETKAPPPLRHPNNMPAATNIKLAANFTEPQGDRENRGESNKRRAVEKAVPIKAPPGGFSLAAGLVPNQSKVPLTSTFVPNDKSDRPGTSTVGVIERARLSPCFEEMNSTAGADVSKVETTKASQENNPLSRATGSSATGETTSSTAKERPGMQNQNNLADGFMNGGNQASESDARKHSMTAGQTQKTREGLPPEQVIMDYGSVGDMYPPPFAAPPYYPYMVPMYSFPPGDPTHLFGKINEMIESFSQDAPPSFGYDQQAFGPSSQGDNVGSNSRPNVPPNLKPRGGVLAREPEEQEMRDDCPGKMYKMRRNIAESFAQPTQPIENGGRIPPPSQSGYRATGPNQSASSTGISGQEQQRAPSPYDRLNAGSTYGAGRPHPGEAQGALGETRAPSPYEKLKNAVQGMQSLTNDNRVQGRQRACSPFEGQNIGTGKPFPVDMSTQPERERRAPSPYEGLKPAAYGVQQSSETKDNQETYRSASLHDEQTADSAFGAERRRADETFPQAQEIQRAPSPYERLTSSTAASSGPQRSSLTEETLTKAQQRAPSPYGRPRMSSTPERVSEQQVPGTDVDNSGLPARNSAHKPGTASAGFSSLVPGPGDLGEPLSPETQKVSFNKASILPPSQVSKRAKRFVQQNLGLDTFENEVTKIPKRVAVDEGIRRVSIVPGEMVEDDDSKDGWVKPGNKHKKRAAGERSGVKPTKTVAARSEAKPTKASASVEPSTVLEDDFIPSVFSLTHLLKKLSEMFPDESRLSLTSAILKVRANRRGQLDNVPFAVIIAEVVNILTTQEAPAKNKKRGLDCKLCDDSDSEEPPKPANSGSTLLPKLLSKLVEKFPGKERNDLINGIIEVRKAHGGTLAGITMVQVIFEVSQHLNSLNASHGSSEQDEDKNSCAICLGSLKSTQVVRALECEHRFHDECIQCWFQKRERTCPVCRSHALLQDDFPRLH